jgi:hypothetical protein
MIKPNSLRRFNLRNADDVDYSEFTDAQLFACMSDAERLALKLYDMGESARTTDRRAERMEKAVLGKQGNIKSLNRAAGHVKEFAHRTAVKRMEKFELSRDKVLEGFLEAIDMAKMKEEPQTMIAGWREVGRMLGLYEAKKHTIDITASGEVQIKHLSQMSTEELLRLADESGDNVIDAE